MEIDVRTLDKDLSFKVRMQAYLYLDALVMIQRGKGERWKLEEYMDKRAKVIEDLLNIKRPFIIMDGEEKIAEVK